MRIAIGQVAHETNTFSRVKTTRAMFEQMVWCCGEELIKRHEHVKDYVGGMIVKGRELGVELIPTFSAFANPSGIITRDCFETMRDELISRLRNAGHLDAICLALHGAGVAEGEDDLEGRLLKDIRAVVGYHIPIVATLDLHANLSKAMVEEANVLLGVNFYPHTDCFDRGLEAMEMTVNILKGKINPVMAVRRLPMLIPTAGGATAYAPAKNVNEMCWQWETRPDVYDCTFFHGFPYTDIPDVCASVIAITEGDRELAQRICDETAQYIWQQKDQFLPALPDPAEGVEQALAIPDGPIVINEQSDNPGGGTPGDGTHLLRELVKRNIPNTCFGVIFDPDAAEQAHKAGVGAKIDLYLGGKTDSLHGEPLFISNAYVKCLSDGKIRFSSPMMKGFEMNYGKSARLQCDNVEIIVCSVNFQTLDDQIFLLHGIDVSACKIVALKSSQHFRAVFEDIAKRIISIDSPGLSTSNLSRFSYRSIHRPMYPLDPNADWTSFS